MKNLLIILAILLPSLAMAGTISQAGSGNIAEQNSNNTSINSGNTSVNSGNTNVTAKGGNAKAKAVAISQGGQGGKGGSAKAAGGQANTGPVDTNIGGTKVSRQAPAPASSFGAVNNNIISCANATGASFTVPGGGLAWNGSNVDRNCQRILLSREIRSHGKQYETASIGLLCRDEELREEMSRAGTPCWGFVGGLEPSAGDPLYEADARGKANQWPAKTRW